MCRRVIVAGFALVILTMCLSSASAQTPFVAVYFDNGFQVETANCPGLGVLDTLYVAAVNFNVFLSGIEYAINYPPALSFIADFDKLGGSLAAGGTSLGSSPSGISMGFAIPQNGFFPLLVQKVLVQWQCTDCTNAADQQVVVKGHPLFNPDPRGTQFPNNNFINAVGLTATICPFTVPVEETTWGQVKSLYSE